MNRRRIACNGLLTLLGLAAGIGLLLHGHWVLAGRAPSTEGLLFTGWPLYLLVVGLWLLAAFAGAVGLAWWRGALPMPPPRQLRPHPAAKGQAIVRFWYLVLPAVLALLAALLLAEPLR